MQLWKRFRGEDKPPAHLGSSKEYNVDMIPKVSTDLNIFPVFSSLTISLLEQKLTEYGFHINAKRVRFCAST